MILLKNCFYVATFNDAGEELKGFDILIKENLIERVSQSIVLTELEKTQTEVIDCSRYLVMPGMVNTHHHLYQTLTRNLPGAQNAKLFNWLTYLYPIWAKINPDGVYYSTLLGCVELLKTGATTTTDHLYLYPAGFPADVMQLQFSAANEVGIRFFPTRGAMTLGQSSGGLPPDNTVQTPQQVLADMERVISVYHDSSPLAMQKILLAPCSPFSVEPSVMRETARLAREHEIILHTHLVETLDEEQYCVDKYGKRPLALMEEWDWLGHDVYFAHGIWFNDDELKILRETGTGVAHCPTSNMRLGSGIARIVEMIKFGIRVGLGVDGSASNDSSDMLGEARNAMLLQRVHYGAGALNARDVLRLATRGGADLLHCKKLGQIKEGCGADLAIFNIHQLQYAGALTDPLAALVFCGFDHRAEYIIVNGKIVVRNARVTSIDEEALFAKVNAVAQQMYKAS